MLKKIKEDQVQKQLEEALSGGVGISAEEAKEIVSSLSGIAESVSEIYDLILPRMLEKLSDQDASKIFFQLRNELNQIAHHIHAPKRLLPESDMQKPKVDADDSTEAFLRKCGGWQDTRSPEEIIADIYAARRTSNRGENLF